MTEQASIKTTDFFTRDMAERYDERNSGLGDISNNLHFLMRLTMHDLPQDARILCVGVGTGVDILALASHFPGWTFTGVDPSGEMLEVGRRRLAEAGLLDRCILVEGYVEDVDAGGFDAVVSLLVAHFVKREERGAFYSAIHDRLRAGGTFLSAEISADLDASHFPAMLADWKQVHSLMGATPDALANLPTSLRETLSVVSPRETEGLWEQAGFASPVPFFQSFMIRGLHAKKGR